MLEEFFSDVIMQSVLITFFVLCMIMILECLNVFSEGHVNSFMQKKPAVQILISAFLGILPGCVGSFTAVSMYTHEVIGFGALMSNLIATTGDEAFFMVSLMPEKAWLIFGILIIISISTGYIINFIAGKRSMPRGGQLHFELHKIHSTGHNEVSIGGEIRENLKHLSKKRIILIISVLTFVALTCLGFFNEDDEDNGLTPVKITFLVLSAVSLFVIIKVSDHFFEDHIWHHVIGKHFKKVFLWTFAALTVIFFLTEFLKIEDWVKSFNKQNIEIVLLLVAVLIGLIPESGPHIVFITLYCSGAIPFTVLLANSIVQDGHGAIPLFAENKRDFFLVKGIKAAIAIVIGLTAIIIG